MQVRHSHALRLQRMGHEPQFLKPDNNVVIVGAGGLGLMAMGLS